MPTAMATAITPCPAEEAELPICLYFQEDLLSPSPRHAPRQPLLGWAKLAPRSEPWAPLAGQGAARSKEKQEAASVWGWMERSRVVGFVLGLCFPACRGFCLLSHLKINQAQAAQECSYREGMGRMLGDEMFKRFESKPKTRSKRQ